MRVFVDSLCERRVPLLTSRNKGAAICAALLVILAAGVQGQDSAPAPEPAQTNAVQKLVAPAPTSFSAHAVAGNISEDQLKPLLVGKTLYLRGGYIDNTLDFDEHGRLMSQSPQGSYTLCAIQVDKVHLSRHRLQLEGQRYALHFLGALPEEDPTKGFDKVKITPKKKIVKISIDREQEEKPEKKKKDGEEKPRGTDGRGVSSPEPATHAQRTMLEALDRVFAPGIDDRMIAAMPDFWKLYFEAAAAKTDFQPRDSGVFRQSTVDQKAKLISAIEPPSNEFAQKNAIAGIALYHAVIGADGKPEEIVAGRPIGFGLDEGAVDTIRHAVFQPAIKDGKPVPVWLDLVVSFRIYSKRTSEPSTQEATEKPADSTTLPGPYSVQHQ
jgi:outer membrane biosynthesis protein TonB